MRLLWNIVPAVSEVCLPQLRHSSRRLAARYQLLAPPQCGQTNPASPYFQRPLELGATLSLSSTTKYVNGHSDCLGGAVCSNDEAWQEKMLFAQKALGLNPSPFDTWLIARGAKTQALRMERHCANALALATYLEEEGDAKMVRYPFLESHPQHALAKRQMRGFGGMMSFFLDGDFEAVREFLPRLKYAHLAANLGTVETVVGPPRTTSHVEVTAEQRAAMGIPESLIRYSVGIEDVDDLIADLDAALSVL